MSEVVLGSLIDGAFAAVAGVGFAFASNPPLKTLFFSAILAAFAHGGRFCLLEFEMCGLASATLISSFLVGLLGLLCAKKLRCPMEVIAFPALIPMIPGLYAYRTVLSIASFVNQSDKTAQIGLLVEITNNLMTTVSVALAIAVGVSISLVIFREQSLKMTRQGRWVFWGGSVR